MNKKIVRVIAVFAVVVLGGGGAFWYVNVNQTKQAVIDFIAGINAKTQADGSKITISYDALETAGFPPALTVRLVNPKLGMTIPAQAAGIDPSQKSLQMNWVFKGYADVITNHLGASYGLHLLGDDTLKLNAGADDVTVEGKQSEYRFSVTAKSMQDFMQWETLDTDNQQQVEKFIKTIAAAEAKIGALNYTVKGSGEPAFTQESGYFKVNNRSDKEIVDFDIVLRVKDSEVHPAYGKVMDAFLGAPPPEMAMMGLQQMPFSASRAGKQNFDIAADIYVDESKAEGTADAPKKLNVDFNTFSVSNNYYTMNAPMRVKAEESAAGGTQFEVVMDTKTTYTEQGANDARKMMESLMGMASMFAAGNPNFNLEAFNAKVNEALPVVSTLGPITFAVDVKGNMQPKAEGEMVQKGTIAINRFDFSHARWGLNAKGNIESVESPTVTLNVNCVKCDTFTSDLVKTSAAAQEAAAMIDPAQPRFPFGDELLAALNQFLASVGKKDAASGDIAFAITTPAANDYRINEKPAATVMMEAMTTLMPFMQPQVPEGVTPPVAGEAGPEANPAE